MADDGGAFRVLTLLLAVAEQALLELERAEHALPSALTASIGLARDEAYAVLTSERFRRQPSET